MNDPEIKNKLEILISTEYANALEKHGRFIDFSQAESVVGGEVYEAGIEFHKILKVYEKLKLAVYDHNHPAVKDSAGELYNCALRCLEELIQVGAMCRKTIGMPDISKEEVRQIVREAAENAKIRLSDEEALSKRGRT